MPWLATTMCLAMVGLTDVGRHLRGPPHRLCIDAGLIYLGVGGAWAALHRAGVRPLEFDSVIVLLTAIHFHYAGFLLPVLASLPMQQAPGRLARLAGLGVIGAMPMVAAGITATQLGSGTWLECLAAWFLAATGTLTGVVYVRLAGKSAHGGLVRVLWGIAGVSLIGGMVLASLYACRFSWPMEWLDIPAMRAFHGTANALGFTLLASLGWLWTRNLDGKP
jgi:hypothetical protein